MMRPKVSLNTDNKIENFMSALQNQLKAFEVMEGVRGITLNGGMSRGYADHLSEIDIVIYLNEETYMLCKNGRSPVASGITKLEGYLYDIKLTNVEEEKGKAWDRAAIWDLSYAKILYDPRGEIKRLIEEKLSKSPEPLEAEEQLFSCWWYYRLAGDIWIHRGDSAQGHYMLNGAVTKLMEALFKANGEYIPHEKWIVHFSKNLPWTPDRWEERLLEAMATGDFTIGSLAKRQSAIEKLWEDIDNYIAEKECSNLKLKVMQKTFYDLTLVLLKNECILLEEWKRHAGLSLLTSEPFHSFTCILGDKIIIDREKALSIKPEQMYYWHFEVLKQALEDVASQNEKQKP
jgi:predicted nucleotidyltransferase